MRRNTILIILLAILLPLSSSAARKKPKKATAPVENPKFTKLLPATASIVIIDSVVCDSASFLSKMIVNPEEGSIATFAQHFQQQGEGVVYQNELGTKILFSQFDKASGRKLLYQSDKIDDSWTSPVQLQGLNDDSLFTDFDYPYLMPDGLTLYFSAKGSESIGGYDIYRTRLDTETGHFLKPENLGLPFNSEADDFMYIIDEQNQLAYFATTRRQPKDTLCIYTFIPFETRTAVNADALSEDQIRSLARIERIADTWGDGAARKQALNRKRVAQSARPVKPTADEFTFVINDQRVCTSFSDFRISDNRHRMADLLSMRYQAEVLSESLNKAYNFYATASANERKQLSAEILNSERQLQQLQRDIADMEKSIRNSENQ